MADRIAVMNRGRIEQAGTASELYERPRTEFVANFLGVSNLIEGRVRRNDAALAEIETHDGAPIRLPADRLSAAHARDGRVKVGVRPEKVALLASGTAPRDGANVVRGVVSVVAFLGVLLQYVVTAHGGEELTVIVQNVDGAQPEGLGAGREVLLAWEPSHTFVVADEEEAHAG